MTQKVHLEPAPTAPPVPVSEQVLDKLADILFATDEILDLVRDERVILDERSTVVAQSVLSVYDQVNELMKTLAD